MKPGGRNFNWLAKTPFVRRIKRHGLTANLGYISGGAKERFLGRGSFIGWSL